MSKLQQQVAAVLTEMKLAARPEVVEPASGYKIDMMLLDLERRSTAIQPHSHLSDQDKRASPAGWLVEIDGPSHFLSSPPHRPRGSTLLKRRHLQV
ncbi:MAG: RAP domain-containing protein, partial [Promethearchaeia archaeon]